MGHSVQQLNTLKEILEAESPDLLLASLMMEVDRLLPQKRTADEEGKGIIWDGRSDGSELSEEHVGNEEGGLMWVTFCA